MLWQRSELPLARQQVCAVVQVRAATAPIYPKPKPSDGHSSANDLATSANGRIWWDAADASRGVAAALADDPEKDHPEGGRLEVASVARGRQREER